MDKISIKIIKDAKITEYIKIIRKYYNISVGELKSKIDNNLYLMNVGYTDEEGIKNIVNLYYELSNYGANVELYEHDRITSITFLNNLLNMYSEISQDIQESDDELLE